MENYLSRFLKAVTLGIFSLIISIIILFILSKLFLPFVGIFVELLTLSLLSIIIFIILFGIIYALALVGTGVYYFSKPMKIKKRGKHKLKQIK